ncbi:MAG: hypothetical protein F4138_07615 [Acidimicrobiia bacterium]|nr:hypothetical protein [Acidimicrobiia bacterium]MYC57539.1 hypothetical protein [Acidimicrobiia bacterium]MYG94830.1 hypothetical protein [Acidimicrobiia bacterium]MYI30097.1 hypothetical protein [Acidimicrobiia bacterium]
MPTASEDRPRQLPWITAGLAITLSTAIIFAIWASSLSDRTAVAVANRIIPAGSKIAVDDLRSVEMAVGQGATYIPITEIDSLLGHVVQTNIAEGTILHPGLISTRSAIGEDQAIAGVMLDPGEYPVAHLSPGQTVGVVLIDNPDLTNNNHSSITKVVEAQVVEANVLPDSTRKALFVSLLASKKDAQLISQAAFNNEVRLILLSQTTTKASATQNDITKDKP